MPPKEGIRILGVDDGPFHFGDPDVVVAGVAMRPGVIEHLTYTRATVDGDDATARIRDLVPGNLARTLHLLVVDGAAVGGFNLIDLHALHEALGVPTASFTLDAPDADGIRNALEAHFNDATTRLRQLEHQWPTRHARPGDARDWHLATAGISTTDAAALLEKHASTGHTPEPLRLAHIAARAATDLLHRSPGTASRPTG